MSSDFSNNKVYINANTKSYLDFVQNRNQKKSLENRIDRLESVIKDMQTKIELLEESRNREET